MRVKLLLMFALVQFVCESVVAQWQEISPDTFSRFSSVFFTTDKKGFVTSCDPVQSSWSSNAVRMTTDGGLTWSWDLGSELCPPAVFFSDSNLGFYFTSGSAIGAAAVNKTTNGGLTWHKIHDGLPGDHVFFVDGQTGYATAANTIAKTNDGGATWMPLTLGGPSVLDAVCFVNRDTGYVGGWYNSVIAKTIDGGASWTAQSYAFGIHAMDFLSEREGYAAGEDAANNNPVIVKTTNGGGTWTVVYRKPVAAPFYFTALQCVGANTCYAAGVNGTILKTNNGGLSWVPEPTGTARKINALHCPDARHCYAAGDSVVLKMTITESGIIRPAEMEQTGVVISPNPAADNLKLTITGLASVEATLRIFNMLGTEVLTRDISGPQTVFSCSQLPSGVYIYHLCNASGWSATGRLIINK